MFRIKREIEIFYFTWIVYKAVMDKRIIAFDKNVKLYSRFPQTYRIVEIRLGAKVLNLGAM